MSTTSRKRLDPDTRTLGARTFAAITAVEGLRLGANSKSRLETLRNSALSAEERRTEIRRAYSGRDRTK